MAENFGENYFDKNYFYGNKKSNYINYDNLNTSKLFGSVIHFIEKQKLKGRFLDIGCAFGLLLKEVSPFFSELYGCDISKFAIKEAKQKIPNANFKLVNLEKSLPYADESFDCITVLDVLEHTKNFELNFKKIVKKLKRGGYLIVSVPIDKWPRRLFSFLDKDKSHISILKESNLEHIIKKNKLEIISKNYFCPFPIFYKIPHIPAAIELILRK